MKQVGQPITLLRGQIVGIEVCAEAARLAARGEMPDAAHREHCPVCRRAARIAWGLDIVRATGLPPLDCDEAEACLDEMTTTFFDDREMTTTHGRFYAALAANPDLEQEFALLVAAAEIATGVGPSVTRVRSWWEAEALLEEALALLADCTPQLQRAQSERALIVAEALALRYSVMGDLQDRTRTQRILCGVEAEGAQDVRVRAAMERVAARLRLIPTAVPGRWTEDDLDRIISLHARAMELCASGEAGCGDARHASGSPRQPRCI